jgi:serine/threonine protein kinase/TolB-like protein
MAEVFLARQSGPDGYERPCVVKRMLSNLADDRTFVRMFLDEARLAAQLTHPNIAQIYDFGEERGAYYLAMEYVPGASVREIVDDQLSRGLKVAVPLAAKIALEIAVALDFAHNAIGHDGRPLTVIHRDVSPHNILLSTAGVVKLIDFGIAKASSASTHTAVGMIKGKFAYMSPEQIRGGALDHRTDLYSLGLVLYEVLTNRPAFDADSERQLQEMVYYGRIRPIEMLRPDVPPVLRRILVRALSKEADGRYPNAAEMIGELERFLASTPSKATARELVTLLPESARATNQIGAAPKRPAARPARGAAVLGEELPPTQAASWSRIASDAPPTLPPDAPPPALLGEATIPDGAVLGSANGRGVGPGRTVTREDRPLPAPVLSASRKQSRSSSRAPLVLLVAALLLALIAGAGVLWYRRQHVSRSVEPASAALRHSVAVLSFQNLGARPEKAWLSTALAEMLAAELAAGGQLRIIPGGEVARMQRELSLEDPGSLSPSTLHRAARNVGSEYVVSGAFLSMGESTSALRVDVHLQRSDGESVAALGESGAEVSARDIASKLASAVRLKLGVGESSAEEAARARAVFSLNPEALRDHAAGLAALRQADLPAARDSLERSVKTDPDDSLAQAALAEALAGLGRDAEGLSALQRALQAADKLPREDALRLQGRRAEATADWAVAASAYRTLAGLHGDDIESALALARALRGSGDVAGARRALEGVLAQGAPLSEDPRVDLERAALAETPQQAVAAAQKAGEKAKELGGGSFLARARVAQGVAETRMGQGEKALADFDEARALCEAASDRLCAADALLASGLWLVQTGDTDQAEARLEQATTIAKEASAYGALLGALEAFAQALAQRGELRLAREGFGALASKAEELGLRQRQGAALLEAAVVDAERGEPSVAGEMDDLRKLADALGDPALTAEAQVARGDLERRRGELTAARTDIEKGVVALKAIGGRGPLASALGRLGAVLSESDPAHAPEVFAEQATIAEQLGDEGQLASNRAARAVLAADDGRAAEAIGQLRDGSRRLAEIHWPDEQARVLTALAGLLAREGYVKDASDAVRDAAALKTEDAWTGLALDITSARLRLDLPEGADPAAEVAPLRQRAVKLHYPQLDFEAQLASAEIDLAAGNKARARARLAVLAKDATAKGLTRIARRASALARR